MFDASILLLGIVGGAVAWIGYELGYAARRYDERRARR